MTDSPLLTNSKAFTKMKLIKDIRLLELDVPNIDYNPTPNYITEYYGLNPIKIEW